MTAPQAHTILTAYKEWNSFEAQRQKIGDRQSKFLLRLLEAETAWTTRTAEYDAKVNAALLEGEEPPNVSQWPGPFVAPAGSVEVFIQALMVVDREQRAWLQANQPEIQKAVEAVERDVLTKARPLVAQLQALSDELDSARRAGDLADSVVGLGRHFTSRVTVETIIEASKNRLSVVSHPTTESPSQIIDRSEVGAF